MASLRFHGFCALVAAMNVAAAAAADERSGRCPGTGYMNLGWSGMSKYQCLKRAYEVNEGPGPAGRCGHVSYSASSLPQSRTDFCQCHSSCEEPLQQLANEKWETYVTSEPNSNLILVILALAGVAVTLLVCLAVFLCWRMRQPAQKSNGADLAQVDAGKTTSMNIVSTAVDASTASNV